MPKFALTITRKEVLMDQDNYIVEAATVEEAAALLVKLEYRAQTLCDVVEDDRVRQITFPRRPVSRVSPLDPSIVDGGETIVTITGTQEEVDVSLTAADLDEDTLE